MPANTVAIHQPRTAVLRRMATAGPVRFAIMVDSSRVSGGQYMMGGLSLAMTWSLMGGTHTHQAFTRLPACTYTAPHYPPRFCHRNTGRGLATPCVVYFCGGRSYGMRGAQV